MILLYSRYCSHINLWFLCRNRKCHLHWFEHPFCGKIFRLTKLLGAETFNGQLCFIWKSNFPNQSYPNKNKFSPTWSEWGLFIKSKFTFYFSLNKPPQQSTRAKIENINWSLLTLFSPEIGCYSLIALPIVLKFLDFS